MAHEVEQEQTWEEFQAELKADARRKRREEEELRRAIKASLAESRIAASGGLGGAEGFNDHEVESERQQRLEEEAARRIEEEEAAVIMGEGADEDAGDENDEDDEMEDCGEKLDGENLKRRVEIHATSIFSRLLRPCIT